MQKPKVIFSWSGGKDSSFALFKILKENQFEVVALLTTLNRNHRRISMHGTREELLNRQAASIGIKLEKVWVKEGTNEEYEKVMEEKLVAYKNEGVTHVIFGDIFLEDLRAYREEKLAKINLNALFPIWKKDTSVLAGEFLKEGFEAITCCVGSKFLNENFVGKKIDHEFLKALPNNIDPCGEYGEFHTFCYKGPIFKSEIIFNVGEKIFRPVTDFGVTGNDGFWFIDLIPA